MNDRTRRAPVTSPDVAALAWAGKAAGPPAVPRHIRLRPQDEPYWTAVVATRSRNDWSAAELQLAAECARVTADLEAESHQLDQEGHVLKTSTGRARLNPRSAIVSALCSRQLSLLRALGIIGSRAPRRVRVPDELDDPLGLLAR